MADEVGTDNKPVITYDGHIHPLVFVEKSNSADKAKKCNSCQGSCSGSALFCCPTCGFTIHLLCGPLPRTLKQEMHLHKLVLKDFLEADHGDDSWYCDSCEEVRDKRACVYYCKLCNYGAEMKCVMPELTLTLSGKLGDTELRTLGRWNLSGKVISRGLSPEEVQKHAREIEEKSKPECFLEDILQSLTEEEKTEFDGILRGEEKLFDYLLRDGICSLADSNLSLDKEFMQLVCKLDSEPLKRLTKGWYIKKKHLRKKKYEAPVVPFVIVGDILIPQKLVHVYMDLCKKCGDDLMVGSKLSPRVKSLVFLFVCEVVEGMWTVKIIDATENILTKWFISLKAAVLAGFEIQFAIEAFRRVLYAYFGIRVMNSQDGISQEIRSLEGKKKSLDDLKGKLREHLERFENVQPALRECLEKAPSLMHAAASEIVLGITGETVESSNDVYKPPPAQVFPPEIDETFILEY